jgi:hypothetical protein
MAFWFFLVITAFVFIWLTTGQHDTLPNSVLALIGIGSGTALGSAAIDASKRAGSKADYQALTAEQTALNTRITELQTSLQSSPPNAAEIRQEITDKTTRLNAIAAQLSSMNASLQPLRSTGFFQDVLSDANGITFHRFQMLVWTLVLGLVFCVSVYHDLAMPEFNSTLLALLGISSGTYLGFKFPEQHA